MNISNRLQLKEIRLLAVIMPLIPGVLISLSACTAEPDKTNQVQNQQVQTQAGQRAFIDPKTGQLTSPTPQQAQEALQLSPEEQNAMSTSHEGLTQQKIPGKGVRLDLQGRFQSSTFATVNDSGEVTITHDVNTMGEKQPLSSAQGKHQKQGESGHE